MYLEHIPIKNVINLSGGSFNKNLSRNTVFQYLKMLSVIIFYFMRNMHNSIVFEGPVEVDETLLYKLRKGRRGRLIKTKIWVLGIIDRITNKCIFYPLKRRMKWKVLSLIFRHLRPGATIYTDCFSIYVNNLAVPRVSYLEQMGYNHISIDHSICN